MIISSRITSLLLAAMAMGSATVLGAQAPMANSSARVGTVVIAHGGDSLWNARVHEIAEGAQTGGPVEVSFLMGPAAKTSRFQDAVARLERAGVSEIVVVPVLVSSHSGHYEQIRYLAGEDITLGETMQHHLHMAGIERPTPRVPLRLAKALDDSKEMARVLADRALALTDTPEQRALLIVGHGPNSAEDYAEWMRNLRQVSDSVKAWTKFRDVRIELVRDDAPAPVRAEAVLRVRELIDLQAQLTGQDVIVVPVLVSAGSVSRDKVPNDIKGTKSVYVGEPLLPHGAMSEWIVRRVRETPAASADASTSSGATAAPQSAPHRH